MSKSPSYLQTMKYSTSKVCFAKRITKILSIFEDLKFKIRESSNVQKSIFCALMA